MTNTRTDVVIRTYGPGQITPLIDTCADVWADAHPEIADAPGDDPYGLSASGLRRQITSHARAHVEGFTLVAAYAHGSMIGFAYGFPCTAAYWFGRDLLPDVPEAVRAGRLLGICEIAVTAQWQGLGIGTLLHTALLTAVAPAWSSLLVRPDNADGRRLYERLGYRYVGPYRNAPSEPAYDLLLLDVHGTDGTPQHTA
ncbi:GNAT family N-acetyltransferase [Streptomyces niveiscabiei]|uniref:GNAT family N-acetyltransferase n=1 Tax=Streptomyces niveiscabiei TaxID=164115 RepID=UPI0006EB5FD1|nr:GNAT family N-acetyltransferase [Streptomyces niveiscabiei]